MSLNDRHLVVLAESGAELERAKEIFKLEEDVAIVAFCDSHLSAHGRSSAIVAARHTYLVYYLAYPAENLLEDHRKVFEQAISVYLNLRGITVRAAEHDINVVRVQVLFGDNNVRPEMAKLICQKMLEFGARKKE